MRKHGSGCRTCALPHHMYLYSERVTAVRPVALASRTMRHTSVSFTFTIALRDDDHSYTHNGTGM